MSDTAHWHCAGAWQPRQTRQSVHYECGEESHRRTGRHILLTLVVGYFAYAQYDIVIAREQSDRGNPSE